MLRLHRSAGRELSPVSICRACRHQLGSNTQYLSRHLSTASQDDSQSNSQSNPKSNPKSSPNDTPKSDSTHKPKEKKQPQAASTKSKAKPEEKPPKSEAKKIKPKERLLRETLELVNNLQTSVAQEHVPPPTAQDQPIQHAPSTHNIDNDKFALLQSALGVLDKIMNIAGAPGEPHQPHMASLPHTTTQPHTAPQPRVTSKAPKNGGLLSLSDKCQRSLPGFSPAIFHKPASESKSGEPKPASSEQPVYPQAVPKGRTRSVGGGVVFQSFDPVGAGPQPVDQPQPPVPRLAYGLDRVLFNPGVYFFRDPRSRVYNFDPYLGHIMPTTDFDFGALKEYVTSSKDTTLIDITVRHGKKYTGSTSSMTNTLSHFHFLLSRWRPLNFGLLSQLFTPESRKFTGITQAPAATFLHWKDGVYAIDADKEFDTDTILSKLGKCVEKQLTLPKEEFEKYRKTKSDQLTEEQRESPESFHYTTAGDFMLRSQLDAYDPRLPGTGMFDLKTRAVVSVRMDASSPEKGTGYEIQSRFGQWESFEREYYDMIRSAFLKYSLQVRMGRMDGIFVAYHNTKRIFGFQYVPLTEMDHAIHGTPNTTLGQLEYQASLNLLNKALNIITKKFPNQTLRLHFETRGGENSPFMYIFARPATPSQVDAVQKRQRVQLERLEQRFKAGASHPTPECYKTDDSVQDVIARDSAPTEEVNKDVLSGEGTEEHSSCLTAQSKVEEVEGASVSLWQDMMDKVEKELENEEQGVATVRETLESVLQQSGLLDSSTPDEIECHLDTLEDALRGGDGPSPLIPDSQCVPTNTEGTRNHAVDATEAADDAGEACSSEGRDQSPTAGTPASVDALNEKQSDMLSFKALVIEMVARARSMPCEAEELAEQDLPAHDAQGLEKFEAVLLELVAKTRGSGDHTEHTIEEEASEESDPREVEDILANEVETKVETRTDGVLEISEEGVIRDHEDIPADEVKTKAKTSEESGKPTAKQASSKEVYGIVLTINNKVNNRYVDRPERLDKKDSWVIEYSFKELAPERVATIYPAVLRRRRKLLEGTNKGLDWQYMWDGRLKTLSDKGRVRREKIDREDQQYPVHVLGSDSPYDYQSVFGESGVPSADGEYRPWKNDEGKPWTESRARQKWAKHIK